MDFHVFDIFPILLFFVSIFGIIISTNVVKTIVLIVLMQSAVILFWLGVGSRFGVHPPIFEYFAYVADPDAIADPLPQALMLTAIIIGIAVTAISITMLNSLFRKYRTVQWLAMHDAALVDEQKNIK
ncbi:MAG: cation:proton antiporter subunit C [Oscillospiraceae bacterium]|nr:cation:proton antiporter subunit C [Oscillospiraceae bacterium]